MDKQQGLAIVEGLRAAQAAGAPVVELKGDDARNFAFVTPESVVLGSFALLDGALLILVGATYQQHDDLRAQDFQFRAYTRRNKVVLTTNKADAQGVVWTYSTSLQDGKNAERRQAFRDVAGGDSIVIPYPVGDPNPFISAVTRAVELRTLAHAAGGDAVEEAEEQDEDDNEGEPTKGSLDAVALLGRLFASETDRMAAGRFLVSAIRLAHAHKPKGWCVTNPGGGELIRLNVGNLWVADLLPGAISFVVDPSAVPPEQATALGSAWRYLPTGVRFPLGIVTLPPSEVSRLTAEVVLAHEAFVVRAARMMTPYSRYHRPEIIAALAALLGEDLPSPVAPQLRYWKLAPGDEGNTWEAWRDGGFAGIGWSKLGDLTAVTVEEFRERAKGMVGAQQVWKFRNLEIGDRIVANDGPDRVLGIGTVTGPYRYVEGGKPVHQIPVRWDDTAERKVESRRWSTTLLQLGQDVFEQVCKPSDPGVAGVPLPSATTAPRGTLDFDGILAHLAEPARSLSFSAEVVASYLLALQAKRFVLLTGISGTGKTRLAQEIARVFTPALVSPSASSPVNSDDAVERTTRPSNLRYSRFIVPSELAQQFDVLADPAARRLDVKVPGTALASMGLNRSSDRSNFLEVLLSGDVRTWFKANLAEGARFLLTRRTSGDKEWLELSLPDASAPVAAPTAPAYELVAVRPDWTDGRALLGFYNPLTKSYVTTPTLQLLLRAHAELASAGDTGAPRPYFLIFDEMNLARVEHYFSDFLSAMESGESIHLHDDLQLEEDEDIPRRITIPRNLFVIGTVNIDETTYMFSPKVLDRAFVLEFNDVDLAGLAGEVPSEAASSTPLALDNLEGGLALLGAATDEEWRRFNAALGGEAGEVLRRIHAALALENRHFGYRVAKEIARFVGLAMSQAGEADATVRAALDVAVFSKVLPKLHGSQAEIEGTLKALLAIALGGVTAEEAFDGGVLRAAVVVPLPRTARKLHRMLRRLRAHGFVSFIE